MSSHQRYTTLTSGSFEVQDQDTDPADITIKVIKGPQNGIQSNTFLVILEEFLEDSSGFSNRKTQMSVDWHLKFGPVSLAGRLRKFDPLANDDLILTTGDVFYYQDVLEGDVSFYSSSNSDEELQLQVKTFWSEFFGIPMLFIGYCRSATAILIKKRRCVSSVRLMTTLTTMTMSVTTTTTTTRRWWPRQLWRPQQMPASFSSKTMRKSLTRTRTWRTSTLFERAICCSLAVFSVTQKLLQLATLLGDLLIGNQL